jgi:hypothetical protein
VDASKADNFRIHLGDAVATAALEGELRSAAAAGPGAMRTPIEEKTIEELKFSECLPRQVAVRALQERLTDRSGITSTLSSEVRFRFVQ